jgi:molybdate transport system substrate-binding protein
MTGLKHDLILRIATQTIAALIFVGGAAAHGAEIRVIGGSAVVHVMAELVPSFEQASGHKVRTDLDGAIGAMTERVRKGEVADVVIVSGAQIDALIGDGKVATGSRTDIAKVGIGAFVRKGAPKPDISSVEAFKQTLISAKSIGYNDPAAGAPVSLYLIGLFERLGIAADVTPKTVVFKQRSERFAAVARGDVELGFNQISEIIAEPGVDLVGPLPAAIRNDTLFSAGIIASGREPAAGREFVAFIVSPQARGIWQAKGFEAP